MGYYKLSDKVYIEGKNYSGISTPSDMKKRGVDKDSCIELDNKVTSIQLMRYYEVSGAVEYGVGVELECTLVNGDKVTITEDGMKLLSWLKNHTSENGIIQGDFLFLFQGVVVALEERGSNAHKEFIKLYNEQENKKKKVKELEVSVGDVVNIYGKSVYLGEYYYYKPNLKNMDTFVNKLRKYKIYIKLDEKGSYLNSEIFVESGKTSTNQPTKVLGNVVIDMGTLKKEALERLDNMFTLDIGYTVTKGYGTYRRALKEENNKAYVLTNMRKNKEDVPTPNEEEILQRGWLCGWDKGKELEYKKDRSGRTIEPYQYAVKI